MIVVQVTDPQIRRAVRRAAHPEEDVIEDARLIPEAVEWGFPRLVVRDHQAPRRALPVGIPVVELDEGTLRRWEAERRAEPLPTTTVDYTTMRLAAIMRQADGGPTWIDHVLADLARASGQRLPSPLSSFGRRILEFPYVYTSLHPVASACRTTRGALKAKFRRRELDSPSTYLRWFRVLAVASLLSDRSLTVAAAARRLGFTSDGNLCRMLAGVAGMTPTEARQLPGWNRLLLTFTWKHLGSDALEAWASMDDLFERRSA